MAALFETVRNLREGSETLRRRRHGVIEARNGQFQRVLLRPWPKLISAPEVLLLGRFYHHRRPGDYCRLYFSQPWRFPNFLAVHYVVSARDTSYQTFRQVVEALDEIARLKRADALLCELTAPRITDQMMRRWGWEPHCPSRWRRHYIKRFYGEYPPRPAWLSDGYQ
ncbi:MAG: hypothetical protein JW809_07915 [Pirellulales bacterium]|nr:hypothetical protein [Pirellulales bacterium]